MTDLSEAGPYVIELRQDGAVVRVLRGSGRAFTRGVCAAWRALGYEAAVMSEARYTRCRGRR